MSAVLTVVDGGVLHQRLTHGNAGARIPLSGQWELTCRCNLKCVMCYTDPHNTPERIRNELSTTEILRILDELQRAGCLELCLTGGEPVARPDFLTIYRAAHTQGFLLTVFSNGTLITEEIADVWAAARPIAVEISLHTTSSDTFEAVTQVSGSLQRCLRGIGLLLERRIPVVLKTVGLALNRDQILAVKRFVETLGPGASWRFGQYLRDDLAHSGQPFRFQLTEEELEAIAGQDVQLQEAKSQEQATLADAPPACQGGRTTFHIDAYGYLHLCSGNRRAGYDLRRGTFEEGFYSALPSFPCPRREAPELVQIQSASNQSLLPVSPMAQDSHRSETT